VRITLVTDWWPPRIGGIESQISDLAAKLAVRGHHVRVLTTTALPTSVGGVEVARIALPMTGEIATPDVRRVRDIAARIDEGTPDVVHAHGMFSSLAIGGLMAARQLDIASVSTTHSLLRPWPVLVGAALVSRLFTRHADVLTAVSAAAVLDVSRATGRSVLHIPNGLDLDEWRRVDAKSGRERFLDVHVVAAMRLVPKKSPMLLVRALREAIRRAPDRVRMTIAGDGPERPRLEREAIRCGLTPKHLTFLRRCSRADVRSLLGEATMFIQPGIREAFGLALLEARAAGVPVVAMRSGGVPEIVEHGRHGLLAATDAEFVDSVGELAANSALRDRCAARASQDLQPFDWRQVASQYEHVYQLAIERPHTKGRQLKNRAAAIA